MLQQHKPINVNLNCCVLSYSYLEEYVKDLRSMNSQKVTEAARWQTEK